MAIQNFSQIQNTFKNYNVDNWAKSVEIGKQFDFRNAEMPGMGEAGESKSFGDFLAESISKVNGLQQDANTAMQRLASGDSQNLHETLLAVERADIALKQMNQVRNKVIDAYREIMKMQV
ncbi:MAG: flagellar hook-basal body complex protein FliE [Halobacteriovoraceae bacterium]|nr:flagellar hook-basal body complex protein FliE [Halobacteriovoraceae bacterium]|tara:strand:- start:3711 stop:4070 length:360 start_codon:yes stop_codon:yes gene_type:complete